MARHSTAAARGQTGLFWFLLPVSWVGTQVSTLCMPETVCRRNPSREGAARKSGGAQGRVLDVPGITLAHGKRVAFVDRVAAARLRCPRRISARLRMANRALRHLVPSRLPCRVTSTSTTVMRNLRSLPIASRPRGEGFFEHPAGGHDEEAAEGRLLDDPRGEASHYRRVEYGGGGAGP